MTHPASDRTRQAGDLGGGCAHLGVPGPAVQAADHSMLGIARTSSLRLGVPECLRTGAPNARRQMFAQQPGDSEHSKMLGSPDAVVTEDGGAGGRADER